MKMMLNNNARNGAAFSSKPSDQPSSTSVFVSGLEFVGRLKSLSR